MSINRTEQDKINRKEANLRYYKLEENKEQKRNYMKSYRARDYVKAKSHEYYIVNKMQWGEITKNKKRNGEVRARKMKTLKDFTKSGPEPMATETMICYM